MGLYEEKPICGRQGRNSTASAQIPVTCMGASDQGKSLHLQQPSYNFSIAYWDMVISNNVPAKLRNEGYTERLAMSCKVSHDITNLRLGTGAWLKLSSP
jgi:hypothetical protein